MRLGLFHLSSAVQRVATTLEARQRELDGSAANASTNASANVSNSDSKLDDSTTAARSRYGTIAPAASSQGDDVLAWLDRLRSTMKPTRTGFAKPTADMSMYHRVREVVQERTDQVYNKWQAKYQAAQDARTAIDSVAHPVGLVTALDQKQLPFFSSLFV